MRTTKIYIDGVEHEIGDSNFLGAGGEADVFNVGGAAAKIYKPGILAPKMPKLKLIIDHAAKFPSRVMAPYKFVYNRASGGQEIGTLAPLASGEDLIRLSQPTYKENNGLDNNGTNLLFTGLHGTLSSLHGINVVIGDFNYNNSKFDPNNMAEHQVMDVDGMSIGQNFPCVAIHPLFFDPKLEELLKQYAMGVNRVGFKATLSSLPKFTTETDWYAFHVLLAYCLMTIHPFHGELDGYNNEFTRMLARKSIFSPGVIIPRSVMKPDQLDDELAHHLVQVFEKDLRTQFPLKLLKPWQMCSTCNIPINKKYCPRCQTGMTGQVAQEISGTCKMTLVFETRGRIVQVAMQAGDLKYVYDEGGAIFREGNVKLLDGTVGPDIRMSISGETTYLGYQNQLLEIRRTGIANTYRTEMFGRHAAFDSNYQTSYRLDGRKIFTGDGRSFGNTPPGKTWFRVGESLGFGFYKIGAGMYYFLFNPTTGRFISLDHLPNPIGKVMDVSCYFGTNRILYGVSSEEQGKRIHELTLLDQDGHVLARMSDEPSNSRIIQSIFGKLILRESKSQGDILLTSTDDGILSFEPHNGTFRERAVQTQTQKYVMSGYEIFTSDGGKSIFVANPKRIVMLTS